MNAHEKLNDKQKRFTVIVILYPIIVFMLSVALNYFALGIQPLTIALPSTDIITALVIAATLLLINHTWLMTSTELVRVRFHLWATPEEWASNGLNEKDASELGTTELKRRHNAHNNTTENTIYFVILALVFALASPSVIAAQVWIIGFALARLGYTASYLYGKDNIRGAFMTLGLLALYGITGNLLISLYI